MKRELHTCTEMQKLNGITYEKWMYLPNDPSQKTKKVPSLLRDKPFGNWIFLKSTIVSFVFGSYFRTLPSSSPEKTNCKKFLDKRIMLEVKHGILLFRHTQCRTQKSNTLNEDLHDKRVY